ncbi:uncharacterized protein LOC126555302 isoform X3 [Aphis gossypii]|uniref:uncharacterized protein LOC126555302 isoform X3 n=1 Tax=Aphis gossypii TaxID=80765 RepID=UPI00215992AA|nr:uncharacterized protein LOC126555302 isoform X3 [Aphis gossypii]
MLALLKKLKTPFESVAETSQHLSKQIKLHNIIPFIQRQLRNFAMLFSLMQGNSEGMEESETDEFIQLKLRDFAMLFSLIQGKSERMEESELDKVSNKNSMNI